MKTKNWPHSDSGSKYRKFDVGENISWDLRNLLVIYNVSSEMYIFMITKLK